ncbi:hypothetical protein L6164_008468 [Bauhinia variegata]|uniref:Uncharacterized protein n=1 Tax=Bauhinia variegata TaxID=167791 RepID=A0ACB9PIB3_BAUVA|nr:hypothetical protein L6164_008468 [Bauhinia variegata]
MAKNPSKLAEVDYSSETWKLTVRVTSMWKVFKFGKMQSLDMVFMDEDILASIHHSIVEKFKHLLEEGKTYMMTNFEVLEDDQQLRVSKLPYKLKFVRTITIRECVLANIPLHAFLFTPFEEILSEKAPSNVLVYVIGQAFNVDDGKNVNVKRKNIVSPMVKFNLLDLNQNVISCTLWNDFFGKFISYMEMKPPSPVVIILTRANIKDTKSGPYPAGVQSYWTTSKLFIDEDIKYINEFKARYRVEVLVHDDENHARFVLWDHESMKLTGHTVNELIE